MTARYAENFYAEMHEPNLASARAVVPLVLSYVEARSVVDIGCGEGLWLQAFKEAGVADLDGFDGEYVVRENLRIAKECFHPANLEEKIPLTRKYDLAVCLEVAEHVSGENSRILIESLTSAAPVILFSAAIPGQGGVRHINEQWPDYWKERFAERGYVPVDCLRMKLWGDKRVSFFYAQNMFFYVAKDALAKHPALAEEARRTAGGALSLVHPQLYLNYQERWSKIAPVIYKIPLPIIKLGKRFWGKGA